jgi:hypothetical protein
MTAFLNLVIGEMFASGMLHGIMPFVLAMGIMRFMGDAAPFNRILTLAGLIVAISFLLHIFFMLILQSTNCGSIVDFGAVIRASIFGALIVGALLSVPLTIESVRLMVSQVIMPHYPLLTPGLATLNKELIGLSEHVNAVAPGPGNVTTSFMKDATAAVRTAAAAVRSAIPVISSKPSERSEPAQEEGTFSGTNPMRQQGGADITYSALAQDKFDQQTFDETKWGFMYMAFFGGCFGVGLGTQIVGKCS